LDLNKEKIFIKDIREGQEVTSFFLLEKVRLGQTKNGRPYVGLKLKDKTGRIEARVWDEAERFYESFKDGDVAQVRGLGESFQGQVQLKVIQAKKLDLADVGLVELLPASPFDPEDMFRELKDLIQSIANPHLKGLMEDILNDEELINRFKQAPAAKRFHHAYVGGLLEHTLSVARTAVAVAKLYPQLNRDLLLTGAIIHDMGKVKEFDTGASGDYTAEGRLLGHLIIGLEILEAKLAAREDFPEDTASLLKHLIISHHGEYQFGSPKKPKILEALALYALDDLDAKLNGIGSFIERHSQDNGWTDYNRLMERFFYKPDMEIFYSEDEEKPVRPKARQKQEREKDPNQMSFLEED